MTNTRSNNTPFWLFFIGIALILVGKDLFAEGMFVDGVTYASISRNMAEGQGSFWDPFYTLTLYPHFRQHPPLALGMEALFFMAFGDHLYIEKIYSLLLFFAAGLLIALIWKRTTNNIRWAWMPLLYWIAIPLVTWSAKNNMLENTMTVFVLLSVYMMIVGYQKHNRTWLFMAGIPLFAAFQTKGFTGLFPLAFPLVYCLFDSQYRWHRGLVDSLLLLLALAVLTGLMFLVFPSSFAYMKDYIRLQVIGGGLHEATVSSRFFIVFRLLQELIGPVVILLVLLVINKLGLKSKVKLFEFPLDKSRFYAFLILGLTGVLPIMVSVKQSGFYMVAALPFFALAMGHASISLINTMRESLKLNPLRRSVVTGLSCVVLVVGLLLPLRGIHRYCRDEALIEEVKQVKEMEGNSIIDITPDDYTHWAKHAYYMRYGKVSLDDKNPNK